LLADHRKFVAIREIDDRLTDWLISIATIDEISGTHARELTAFTGA
jgi:hypothetical protein